MSNNKKHIRYSALGSAALLAKNFFGFTILFLLFSLSLLAADRQRENFNVGWRLMVGDVAEAKAVKFNDAKWKRVTLPNAFNEDEAFKLDIHNLTDTVMWYRKHFKLANLKGRKVFVEFEGIRQGGDFYINGEHVGIHENGVMAVGLDITKYAVEGENVIAVRVDSDWDYRERATRQKYQWCDRNFNANYGGIPKNVWLHLTDNVYQTLPLYSNLQTTGVYVYASDIHIKHRRAVINAESEVKNESSAPRTLGYRVTIKDIEGKTVKTFYGAKQTIAAGAKATLKASAEVGGLHFWSWGYGYLYTVETELIDEQENAFDRVLTRTGFRKTRFAEGKFWLNDRVLQIHGYAQRTSNEWPAVGMSVPAWLSDYSNNLVVESNGNLIRWMHVTPWKQDVESCDRVGLLQAMPAGDAEKDVTGNRWIQRTQLMRDAIIYNRNNPSIIFYECGNESISREHMIEMKHLRDIYDPHGGRAIGSREMLDINEAEYGGEMLYINKSKKHPMWATEYCRDEGLRKYWDEQSYPFHKEGQGPDELHSTVTNTKKKVDPLPYNHNQDQFAVELVRRWYDYWRERPGTGTRVSSGGAKIVFSDTNTHFRGVENYRRSGVTDAMRIPKDGFYAHQVMWNGWVDTERYQTFIVGHWNYEPGTKKTVYVVSNGEEVELLLNGKRLGKGRRDYNFLFSFDNVKFEAGVLEAISYDAKGEEVSRYIMKTAGEPAQLRLTTIENPDGFKADGADMALLQFEVVDKDGRRCPLDNREVKFTVKGEGEWRGGIAQGPDNYILSKTLPVECGVNRAIIRSTTKPGKITVEAAAKGLPKQKVVLTTKAADYRPPSTLFLTRGETPATPSYTEKRRGVEVVTATAGANSDKAFLSFDDNELSEWTNDGKLSTAWITYSLEREALVDDVCIKLTSWRNKSYPLEVLAADRLIWSGNTEKSLGYVHLNISNPVKTDKITIRLKNADKDAGEKSEDEKFTMTELAGGKASELDNAQEAKGSHNLRIVEVEFLENISKSSKSQP
ncbi:MAG: DUF4982 domain-containing protein [Bacteroidaceae bacterium]|nr:DUF4982 domain-containing protein [Bacteroidaceae bacterium]